MEKFLILRNFKNMNDDNIEWWQHYLLHTQLLIQFRKSLCLSFHNSLWKTKDHKLLLCKRYYFSKGNANCNKRKILLVTRYFYVKREHTSSWSPFPSPGNRTGVSCIAGRFFTNWAIGEPILVIWKCKCKSLSRVWLFATLWTLQSMEFSHGIRSMEFARPKYWSG